MTSAHRGAPCGSRVVVIGEDSSSSVVGLTALLEEDGFQAVLCKKASTALESLPRADAVVVEQRLPHEHLETLLAQVVRRDPRIPIFVITPYCDTEQRLSAVDLRPRRCFSMPLVYDELVAALHDHVVEAKLDHPPIPLDEVTPELIARLDRHGPRYTSYPTAPVFSDDFSERDYRSALEKASSRPFPLSIYVHLPFCRSMCAYCACNVAIRKDIGRTAGAYVKRLSREAQMVAALVGGGRKVAELHLGGGTPNYLPRKQLERLVSELQSAFPFAAGAVRAIEVDPRHFEEDQMRWLAGLGFTRVSLGIQDVDERVQSAIGRMQSFESTREAFLAARAAGFDSINMDLVYGLPSQTRESFARTLEKVIDLGPDRLAVFSFAYVPSHKPNQKKLDVSTAPRGIEKARLLLEAIGRLTDAGYVQVGMDHFARPGDPLARSLRDGSLHRNFQGYVPGPALELIGLGSTGIGDIGGCYSQNLRRLSAWERAIDEGRLPVEKGWKRSFDDEVRRAVIQALMCRFELSFSELSESYGIDHDRYFEAALPALGELEEQGLVRRSEQGLFVTGLGRLFVRNIAMAYDAYLPGMRRAFSRTV
ncbi:MAG: oxygen-independent coproporphyrinogen III oxidase [Myxococcota bacterium]